MQRHLIRALKKVISQPLKPTPPIKDLLPIVTVNTEYEIPYLAGYSFDGKTIYIDKRLPRYFKLKSGNVIDTYTYLVVHEVVEKWYENLGYKYPYAHERATGFERVYVTNDNIPWNEYQNYMLTMVKKLKTFSGPLPLDLDTKPEKDTHDYYRYHKIEKLKRNLKYEDLEEFWSREDAKFPIT